MASKLITLALVLSLAWLPARAGNAAAPAADVSGLPVLGSDWLEENPYRGNPRAIEVGRSAYDQACARCHGAEPARPGAAADLTRVDAYCRRIADAAMRRACMRDNDVWFSKSVREGKVRLGVVHMPAWEGTLTQEEIWAIQTYVESSRK